MTDVYADSPKGSCFHINTAGKRDDEEMSFISSIVIQIQTRLLLEINKDQIFPKNVLFCAWQKNLE